MARGRPLGALAATRLRSHQPTPANLDRLNSEIRSQFKGNLMSETSTSSLTAPTRPTVPSIRLGTLSRKPWVPSSADGSLLDQASYYLHGFDHEQARLMDPPVVILAKVVCNLRNYYRQDQASTVRLIRDHFNPKAGYAWSPEGIRLTWEEVARFTPSLGLADEKAIAKQRLAFLENEVVDLIAWTVPGGRVWDKELEQVFREWNPELELEFKGNSFSRAVKAVTGLSKSYSNGKGYWVGFHLPTADEVAVAADEAA